MYMIVFIDHKGVIWRTWLFDMYSYASNALMQWEPTHDRAAIILHLPMYIEQATLVAAKGNHKAVAKCMGWTIPKRYPELTIEPVDE